MSVQYAGYHYSRRLVVFSSDNDLPPSDPPEPEDEDEDNETFAAEIDENPFLTSDDIPLFQSSSDDIPLASILWEGNYSPRRTRSSSLPIPIQPSDDIIFTPRTERKHQKFHTTQKRLDTYARNKQLRLTKAENEKAEKEHTKELLFDEVLKTFQQAGISLADFLHYVFKPTSKHVFDWKWRGFFRDQETVKAIFGYWTTSEYNKTTRTFIKDWILGQAEKVIAQESRVITEANILRKSSMVINEDFFLNFSLESITNQLCELAPAAFGLFDAFSTTGRQKRELKAKSRRKQKLVCHCAPLKPDREKAHLSLEGAGISHSRTPKKQESE
jgi:hypothetical protein